jgi:flagellar motor switch protein FliM
VVANGVRETLTNLLGTPIEMRLFEPTLPPGPAWLAILHGAILYRVRGSVADAAIILRCSDALALAAALFGERANADRNRRLSPIERDVLDRTVNALAAHLASVCGAGESLSVERVETICGFSTFFELLLEEPVATRIGIALSRDPSPEPRARFEIDHLASVSLTAKATLELGRISSGVIARLVPGAIVPMRSLELHACRLHSHGRIVARGTCGVVRGRFALHVDALC